MSQDSGDAQIGEIYDEAYVFKEVTWKIPKDYIEQDNPDVRSAPFSFAGSSWSLHVSADNGTVDLGIEKLDSQFANQIVFCRFYFKTYRNNQYEPVQGAFIFNAGSKMNWMLYTNYKSAFLRQTSVAKGGVFTLVCEMRIRKTEGIGNCLEAESMESVEESTFQASEEELKSSSATCKECGCTCHQAAFPGKKTLADLKALFLKQEDCDVIIQVKEKKFFAHKNILTARSPVFASMFRNEMEKKAPLTITIEDGDPSSFSDFLCFLYCGNLENISIENVYRLFAAAAKYDVQDLRSECMEFIKKNLSVDMFRDVVSLADQYFECYLIELIIDFLAKNLQEIVETVEWQSFLLENPIQSNELLIKALAFNKK